MAFVAPGLGLVPFKRFPLTLKGFPMELPFANENGLALSFTFNCCLFKQTPLHLSVLTRQQDICRVLVLGNAQIDCTDRNGDTPLHIACRLRDEGCIRALTEGISPLERKRGMVPQNRASGVQQLPQNLELRNFEGKFIKKFN